MKLVAANSVLIPFFFLSVQVHGTLSSIDNHIKIDQFGYRTGDKKVAVISNPQVGYNAASTFTPGPIYEVRRVSDDSVFFTGTPVVWNGGATHSQSGDKIWWFDFSALTVQGTYYVYDVNSDAASYNFTIDDCIYEELMKHAMRMFYYQRCGYAKTVAYADTGWNDPVCHWGILQDTDCRLYNNTSFSTSKHLVGGWHDAGDYNKYVNFTFDALLDLLFAYEQNPGIWGDDYNIPESGNGTSDILDEIKHEFDWLLLMQQSDGSVLSMVGVENFASASPPSADAAQRLYGPATTSASYTAAAVFALGAIEYYNAGLSAYAWLLEQAAISSYTWAEANPGITFYNTGIIGAGEQELGTYDLFVRRMAASVFLFALTNDTAYQTFVDTNYTQVHLLQWNYAYPFETGAQDALLYYAALPGATTSVANAIMNSYMNSMQTTNADNLPAYLNQTDAYRAYLADNNYTWGSNTTKGRQGNMFMNMIHYNLDASNDTNYRQAALGFLNYFHGINPTAFAYISNMGNYDSENSINEFYHSWFTDGDSLWDRVGVSVYGPAPGYIPGGPNPGYDVDACCPSGCSSFNTLCADSLVTPPLNQPIQKSYRDWNTGWPQNSWTVTECGIYTQAAYVRLLSSFLNSSCFFTATENNVDAKPGFTVYPNPAHDNFTVAFHREFELDNWELEIIDVTGRVVHLEKIRNSKSEIKNCTFSSGLYLVKVKKGEKELIQKLVIQ
jgi:endoglucanase